MTVRSYPRIHLSLLDLGNATLRKYGGAGFAVSGLPAEIEAHSSNQSTNVLGLESMDQSFQHDILLALERITRLHPGRRGYFRIKAMPPKHVGLGSKTALILCLLEAANQLWSLKLERETLQMLSGRGGTSGIGVNTFFTGCFVVDGGHNPRESRGFVPSSAAQRRHIPPVICKVKIPTSWRFSLILPAGLRYADGQEAAFFRKNSPIPKQEILSSLSIVYHGVAPAVILNDLPLLKKAVAMLQNGSFKRREIDGQPKTVHEVLTAFNDLPDCAVGLSSMGPLVYVIADKGDAAVQERVKEVCKRSSNVLLGIFAGRNRGRQITP